MKKWLTRFVLVLLTACPLASFGQTRVEKDPAYLPIDEVLDLKTIRPEVNLNLPRFLLKDALSELNGSTNGSPIEGVDIADLIKDVKLIRVVVIEANQTNRPALDKALKMKPDNFDALTYINLLYRERAKIETDPAKQAEDMATADKYREQALELRKKSLGTTPTPEPGK